MHIKKILTVGAVALAMAFGSNGAEAAYDYTGSSVDMGTVSVGDTGTIGNIGNFGPLVASNISGSLPSNSMITFTYSFSGNVATGVLGAFGDYDYNTGTDSFSGYASSSNLFGSNSAGIKNGSASTPLAVASAQIDYSNNTATAVIKNISSGTVDYLNMFVGFISGNKNLEVSYSVSAVPLPAALPLFLAGLAALMGFSHRRKKQEVAVAA